MKICLAQTKSTKGEIQRNIDFHLKFIERAISLKSDIIIFPELSITGYEPLLAKKLVSKGENTWFNPIQHLANKSEITICVGMPTKADNTGNILISMLIFQPNKELLIYSKQLLHPDELPYFVCGTEQTYLTIKGKKLALGICYETLQEEHFINAKNSGADIYIASVAKSNAGIEKALNHFPKMASTYKTHILMVNNVGYNDNFLSVGQSAVWNTNGTLLQKHHSKKEGLIIYDTNVDKACNYLF